MVSVSAPDVDTLVVTGLQAHQSGKLEEAAALYAEALRRKPDHPDALNLSGALAFSRGDTNAAIRLIGKAIRFLPTHADAHLNLAEAFGKAGRLAEAIATAEKVLTFAPHYPDVHARLAKLHSETGAAELALAFAKVALALGPPDLEVLCARGLAHTLLRQFNEADASYRQALELAPDDLRAIGGRAALMSKMLLPREAAALYRRAVELDPGNVDWLSKLAAATEFDGDIDGALALLERALKMSPNNLEVLFRQASCLRDLGDFEGAAERFRRVLSISPNYAPAVLALARISKLDAGPDLRKHLGRFAADPAQLAAIRVQAGFALGEILDRDGDTDAAFKRFAEANALHARDRIKRGERFDRAVLRDQADLIEARLAAEYARDTAGWGNPTTAPVFVVGLPRSGTTLVEQICASHSQVVGVGEIDAIQTIARDIAHANKDVERLADWDSADARRHADRHAEELATLGGEALRVVDKTPLNLLRLGLIGALFPNAHVIRCRRDLRDVVVSQYTMYFSEGNLFSTDQADCAYAAKQIERIGSLWQATSRLKILDVVYEDLVADLEANVRRIIDFLELPWEPTCLDFQNTKRHVDTPSSWQVRQPIYSTSVGRWRRFEKHLGPMLAVLREDV